MPKVSILIPTYNSGRYIVETLDSALSQTYQDVEIIVVDNASTDDTWSIILEFKKNYSKIKIFQNETNIGPIRNWLRCIEEASGEFGKILWSDDLLDASFLECALPFIDTISDVGFIYTPAVIFNDVGERKRLYTQLSKDGLYSMESFIKGILYDKDYPNSPACALFRLADLQKYLMLKIPNNFDSDASQHAIGNDLLLFLLTAKDYKNFYFLSTPLAYFRSHDESITISSSRKKLVLNYDIAKAYFVDNFIRDESEIKKFNSILWLHNLVYRHIPSLDKMYIKNNILEKDLLFLLGHILNPRVYLRRMVRKIING